MGAHDAPIRFPWPLGLPLRARQELLDRGELDPACYRASLVDHIRREDPRIRAFVDWRPADIEQPGLPGAVSVTYKDTVDVAGYATRLGIQSGYRRYPERSSYVAARLAERGLCCIGKVATTECALGTAKPSRNPAYPHLSTAGSSAGSAAAVAAGFCDVSVGTDSGGSLRWPAVYCGATALRLTPRPAFIEGVHVVSPSMESVGLITRSVGDLGWLWRRFELAATFGLGKTRLPARPRVAISAPPGEPLHPEISSAFEATAAALDAAGYQVTRLELAEVWAMRAPAGELLAREAHDSYGPIRAEPGVSLASDTLAAIDRGAEVDDIRYAALLQRKDEARALLARLLREEFDLLVTPLEAGLPDPVDAPRGITLASRSAPSTHFALLANIAGLPVLAQRVASSSQNAPLGVQVLAAPEADGMLVEAAEALEGSLTGARPR